MNKELSAHTSLSHYRIVSKIGAGGMGEVYLAEDTRLDRQVAVKLLPSEFTQDADRVRRFMQEAKAASALNHPNIITVYDIGESEAGRFIVMELVAGRTLRAVIAEDNSLETLLRLGIQMTKALSAAHAAGITHRDIKPDNIMVRDDGYVKVLDFGLARLAPLRNADFGLRSEEAETLMQQTMPGTVMGTVAYMSPEQARGETVNHPSDIFALGIVLYELATGQHPFKSETLVGYLHAITLQTPAPLSQLTPAIPAALEVLLLRMLEKEAPNRPTATAVAQTLQELERSGITATPDNKRQEFSLQAAALPATNTLKRELLTPEAQTVLLPATTNNAVLPQRQSPARRTLLLSVLLGVLLLTGAGLWLFRSVNKPAIESIAVLPFVNASGNADIEYLSDGMTETLISSLSTLPKLNVKARSSVFRYKGKEFDLAKIARELNVQAILTGRVVQRGDQLTLSLELVNAQTENAIWSEQYNRKQTDLVTLQSEIARDVSSKLKTKLSGADEAKVTKKYTANPEAYQLYLKGRFQWNKRKAASLKQAVEFYQQALAKDPGYALAYAGLAETYAVFQWYSVAASRDSMPQAKAAALRALAIDESLAEGHAALGLYLSAFEWNQPAAEKELHRAIELNPNYATGYQWLADPILRNVKRYDEALAAARRAEELDPLSPIISANVGMILWHARRYDEAIAQFKHALALDPNFYFSKCYLAATYHSKKMYAEAIVEFRKARELDDDPLVMAYLARTLAKSGGRSEAIKLRDQLHAEATRRYVPHYAFVLVYAALGDKDEAFQWLEKDFLDRTSSPPSYGTDPSLDDLRDDPRFADFVRRVEQAKMD